MSRQASGLRAWAYQRISALYLGLYVFYSLIALGFFPPESHVEWKAWVSGNWASIGLLLFFLSLLIHAWVGVRDVLIDYVHPTIVRLLLLIFLGLGLISCGFWVAKVIFLTAVIA